MKYQHTIYANKVSAVVIVFVCVILIFIQKVALARRQRRDLSVFKSRRHISTTRGGAFTLPFFIADR